MKSIGILLLKRMAQTIVLFSFSLVFLLSCNEGETDTVNKTDQEAPKPFASSAEAVQKGKSDLVELLKVRTDLNLGVDAAQIEKSQPGKGVAVADIDFQKLLEAEDISDLKDLADPAKGEATPLSADNQVLAIIDTRKDADGWMVSGIANQEMKKELNEIRKAGGDYKEMTYFEVPNIRARIYSVSVDDETQYLTSYDGFSLSKPVPLSELLPKLKEDAQAFEKRYGEELRKGRLVN